MLKQIYEKRQIDCTIKDFLMENFSNCFELEEKLKNIEYQMAIETDNNILEKLMNKYGRIQDEFIINGGYDIQEKYKKICSGFHFGELFLGSMYNNLSGGERTKVNLAKILMSEPDILLLDEPTNHLDVETLEWLEELLSSYSGTILVVSHDRYFLDKICNKLLCFEGNKIVESLRYSLNNTVECSKLSDKFKSNLISNNENVQEDVVSNDEDSHVLENIVHSAFFTILETISEH